VEIDLPKLCDKCAVVLHTCLLAFLDLFAHHYDHRIEHFYRDHSYKNTMHIEPSAINMGDDEAPFGTARHSPPMNAVGQSRRRRLSFRERVQQIRSIVVVERC